MCIACATGPGYWIQTILDCAREEKVTIQEATDQVAVYVTGEALDQVLAEDGIALSPETREAVAEKIRRTVGRDGKHAEELLAILARVGEQLSGFAALLPVAAEQIQREDQAADKQPKAADL